MSKTARVIAARGLTASDRGKVIEYFDDYGNGHKVQVDSISYIGNTKTVVKFVDSVAIPNMQNITVID